MKRLLLFLFASFTATAIAQQNPPFQLWPGPFALCEQSYNPALCGVWEAQGKPVEYWLAIQNGDASQAAYEWHLSGTTITGEPVNLQGVILRQDGSLTVIIVSPGAALAEGYKVDVCPLFRRS